LRVSSYTNKKTMEIEEDEEFVIAPFFLPPRVKPSRPRARAPLPEEDDVPPPRDRRFYGAIRSAVAAVARRPPPPHGDEKKANLLHSGPAAGDELGAVIQRKPLVVFEWARMKEDDSKYCYLCETLADTTNFYRQTLLRIIGYKMDGNVEFLFQTAEKYFAKNIQPFTATKEPFPARAIYRHFREHDKKDETWRLLEELDTLNQYDKQYINTGSAVDPTNPDQPTEPDSAHVNTHLKVFADRRKVLNRLSQQQSA
jgi:hypothetical protein